jgi:hypothetical protein
MASDCWAAGYTYTNSTFATLTEQWNGATWVVASSPDNGSYDVLYGITCVTVSECWAVGDQAVGLDSGATLIEEWTGTGWAIVTSPNSAQANTLEGVTCTSASICWAVGFSIYAQSADATLVENWEGGSWNIIASPNTIGIDDNLLSGVTCLSPSDCWAVGYTYAGGSAAFQTLVERWDGTSWTIVPSPNPDGTPTSLLEAVSCVSSSDCWAVGYSAANPVAPTLIEQWNGSSWNIVTSPNMSGALINVLYGVSCVSSSDCWAAGYTYNGSSGADETLIEHWDGGSWEVVAAPDTAATDNDFLNGVSCLSASVCWAVGYSSDGSTYQTLTEQLQGNSWAIASSPDSTESQYDILYGIACVTPSECWTTGLSDTEDVDQPLIEQWNGASWAIVASPSAPGATVNVLRSVTCVSAANCWAVGYSSNQSAEQTLIEQWNGTSWATVTSSDTSIADNNLLRSVACVSASDCWAVGDAYSGSTDQTLTEQYSGTPGMEVPDTPWVPLLPLLGVAAALADLRRRRSFDTVPPRREVR